MIRFTEVLNATIFNWTPTDTVYRILNATIFNWTAITLISSSTYIRDDYSNLSHSSCIEYRCVIAGIRNTNNKKQNILRPNNMYVFK